MKTVLLLFALSLYLLPDPTHSTFNPIRRLPTADVAVVASDTPVRDTKGNEVTTEGGYYMVFPFTDPISEVRYAELDDDGSTKCPTDIILSNQTGQIVEIKTADPSATVVLESTPLNIKFNFQLLAPCENKVYWEIGNYESGRHFVKAGNVVSYPFIIQRVPVEPPQDTYYWYRIIHCPTSSPTCFDVSLYEDKSVGALRLALDNPADTPLIVAIQNVFRHE